MIGWLLGSIPSWAWILLGLIAAGVVVRLVGWRWALGVLAAAGAIYMQSRAYQKGAQAEAGKQAAADEKAETIIAENKAAGRIMTDDELNREVDRWTRKP